jgi:hypothetical protein
MRRRHVILSVTLMVAAALCAEAQAQQLVAPYTPAKPTLSPYLYLTRPNQGPLPNYQTFVEPLKNQAQVNRNQQAAIQDIQQQIQQTQQILTQQDQQTQPIQTQQTQPDQTPVSAPKAQWKITPPNVAPTGSGSSYGNSGGKSGAGKQSGSK